MKIRTNTNLLVMVLSVLIASIFIRFYMTVVDNIKIVQLSLAELTPSILMQKNPIIIDERIVNPISLLHTVFKFMYVYKKFTNVESGNGILFKQNKARFLILYSNQDNCSIDIVNPKHITTNNTEPPFIEIKLHSHMCMVLPYKWFYRLKEPASIASISLEDIVSLTVGKIFT